MIPCFLHVVTRGLLRVGLPSLARPLPLSGDGPGDDPSRCRPQPPQDWGLSQRRYRWLSGSRGKGGVGNLPLRGSWQRASLPHAQLPLESGTLSPFCLLFEGW